MICPYCGTHIADGLSVCPACHSTLDLTMSLPKLDGTYCKTCGALVPDGMHTCPSCGMPVTSRQPTQVVSSYTPAEPQRVHTDTMSMDAAQADKADAAQAQANTSAQSTHATLLGKVPSVGDSTLPPKQSSTSSPLNNIPSLEESDISEGLKDQDDESAVAEAEQTNAIPRIASALPANSKNGYAFEKLPSLRTVVTAALASLLLVGVAVLYFTHPWAPDGYTKQNTTEKDISKAGFPGVKEKLAGQDSDTAAATTQVESGDEQTYKKLVEHYKKLGSLAKKTDENVESFSSIAFSSDSDAIKKAADEATSLSYQTSNLIAELQALHTTTGTYVTQINQVTTLGNYLRNRLDIVNKAWKAVVASNNPSADKSDIMSILRSSQNGSSQEAYKSLFEQNYANWNPES